MKNYNNYYPSPYEKIKNDSLLLTAKQIEIDGEIYKVDGKEYPLIVEHHSNPLTEVKEERKVICSIDVPIHWGSIIEDLTLNEMYIVISDIDVHNNVYKETKMQKANKNIKWQDETGKLCECPAISKDFSLYTDGIQEGKQVTTFDSKVNITVPLNKDTLKLDVGKRIILTRRVYEITSPNDFEFTNSDMTAGVIKITMTVTEHDYTITTTNTDTTIEQNKTLQFNVIVKDNDAVIDNPAIIYKSDNANCTVSDTGLITGIALGISKITATFTNTEGTVKSISINIIVAEPKPQDNFTYTLTGDLDPDTSIKAGSYIVYTVKKLNNGIEVAGTKFDFEVIPGDTPSDAYTLTVNSDTECRIDALKYMYTIALRAKDRDDNAKYIDKEITLKGLW